MRNKKRSYSLLFFILPPLSLFSGIIFFLVQTRVDCSIPSVQPPQQPVQGTPEITALQKNNSDYARLEESTYLTYPEWFIVYSAVEYGSYLEKHTPSSFPYFSSIGQYWCGYSYVFDATRNRYEFNFADHVVLLVIGTSYSVEYSLKGVYENTIGRYAELVTGNRQTQEDRYAEKVAKEYGQWLYTIPWYDFPFFEKLRELWQDTDLIGPNLPRKFERKFNLTLEYGIKGLYGKALASATHATYTPAEEDIMLWTGPIPESVLTFDKRIHVVSKLPDDSLVILLPRYQEFSDIAVSMVRSGVKIYEIGGNDEIFLTAIAPYTWEPRERSGKVIFQLPIVTDRTKKRIGISSEVKNLENVVLDLENQNVSIEHLYDY